MKNTLIIKITAKWHISMARWQFIFLSPLILELRHITLSPNYLRGMGCARWTMQQMLSFMNLDTLKCTTEQFICTTYYSVVKNDTPQNFSTFGEISMVIAKLGYLFGHWTVDIASIAGEASKNFWVCSTVNFKFLHVGVKQK